MNPDVRQRLEYCLRAEKPTEALRRYAVELASQGLRRQAIYNLFFELHNELERAGMEADKDCLGDVMDMIMGTYHPFNLNIPQ